LPAECLPSALGRLNRCGNRLGLGYRRWCCLLDDGVRVDVGLLGDCGLWLNRPGGRTALGDRLVVLALLDALQRRPAATRQLIDGLLVDVDVSVALNGLPNAQSQRL